MNSVSCFFLLFTLFLFIPFAEADQENEKIRRFREITGYFSDNSMTKLVPISPELKQQALEAFFKKYYKKLKYHKNKKLKNLVNLKTVADYGIEYNGKHTKIFLYAASPEDICISISYSPSSEYGPFSSFPIVSRTIVSEKDMAFCFPSRSPRTPINPITNRPFFSIPPKLLPQLSDPKFYQTLSFLLSSNFGMLLPVFALNERVPDSTYYGQFSVFQNSTNEEKILLELGLERDSLLMSLAKGWGYCYNLQEVFEKSKGKKFYTSMDWGPCTGYTGYSLLNSEAERNQGESSSYPQIILFNGVGGVYTQYCQSDQMFKIRYALNRLLVRLHSFARHKGLEPGTSSVKPGLNADQQLLALWCHIIDNYYSCWLAAMKEIDETEKDAKERKKTPGGRFLRKDWTLKVKSYLDMFGRENTAPLKNASLSKEYEEMARKGLRNWVHDLKTKKTTYSDYKDKAFEDWLKTIPVSNGK